MLNKSIKWSLFLSLTIGLSSCMWQMERGASLQPMMYDKASVTDSKTSVAATKTSVKASKAGVVKTNSSIATEPVQKSTPGPKRAAAPQLPVIQ